MDSRANNNFQANFNKSYIDSKIRNNDLRLANNLTGKRNSTFANSLIGNLKP